MAATFEKKFIYRPITGKVNYDAKRLLNISSDEYLYLDLINQFQDKSGTGWAELNKANNYTKISDFKLHLAGVIGLKERSMYNLFKEMKSKGYIEEKPNGFRVTERFWILKGQGETFIDSTPSVSKEEKDGKCFYLDSNYAEFEAFKTYVVSMFPNDNIDVNHYYEAIKKYYTTENTKAYKNWDTKIMDWIRRQIKDGDVRTTNTPSVNRSNDELIQDIREYYAKMNIRITEATKFADYKTDVESYIKACDEAEKRQILPIKAKENVELLKSLLVERGGLGKHLQELKLQKQTAVSNSS